MKLDKANQLKEKRSREDIRVRYSLVLTLRNPVTNNKLGVMVYM